MGFHQSQARHWSISRHWQLDGWVAINLPICPRQDFYEQIPRKTSLKRQANIGPTSDWSWDVMSGPQTGPLYNPPKFSKTKRQYVSIKGAWKLMQRTSKNQSNNYIMPYSAYSNNNMYLHIIYNSSTTCLKADSRWYPSKISPVPRTTTFLVWNMTFPWILPSVQAMIKHFCRGGRGIVTSQKEAAISRMSQLLQENKKH